MSGFYIALFPILIKAPHIYSVTIRIRQLPYYVQVIHTSGQCSMDNIPSNYLNNAQVNEAIKTKYLTQGHKHVGTSRARTHNLASRSPALFR